MAVKTRCVANLCDVQGIIGGLIDRAGRERVNIRTIYECSMCGTSFAYAMGDCDEWSEVPSLD